MELEGRVISGLGKAKQFVAMIKEAFFEKYKIELFPGTLNIKLDKKMHIATKEKIDKQEYGGSQTVFVQECKIFEEKAYILRAEKNNLPGGDYNLDIIEIAATANLREKYSIKDGDKVIIKLI